MKIPKLHPHSNKNTEWQDAIIERLDLLAKSQNQVQDELAELVATGKPTPRGRLLAYALLTLLVTLVITSASVGIYSSRHQAQATTSQEQALAASEQVGKDLQPIMNIVSEHGVQYLYDHPDKSVLTDAQAADNAAQQMNKYNSEADQDYVKYIVSDDVSQVMLAVSSAFLGAVAGWLLIPLFVERTPSRPK